LAQRHAYAVLLFQMPGAGQQFSTHGGKRRGGSGRHVSFLQPNLGELSGVAGQRSRGVWQPSEDSGGNKSDDGVKLDSLSTVGKSSSMLPSSSSSPSRCEQSAQDLVWREPTAVEADASLLTSSSNGILFSSSLTSQVSDSSRSVPGEPRMPRLHNFLRSRCRSLLAARAVKGTAIADPTAATSLV